MFALRQRILGPAASLAKRSLCTNVSLAPQQAPPPALVVPVRGSTTPSTSLAIATPAEAIAGPNHTSSWMVTNTLWNATANWWTMLKLRTNFQEMGIYMISTLKRRRKMMNKHKLRKRRKKNRMKNKK